MLSLLSMNKIEDYISFKNIFDKTIIMKILPTLHTKLSSPYFFVLHYCTNRLNYLLNILIAISKMFYKNKDCKNCNSSFRFSMRYAKKCVSCGNNVTTWLHARPHETQSVYVCFFYTYKRHDFIRILQKDICLPHVPVLYVRPNNSLFYHCSVVVRVIN